MRKLLIVGNWKMNLNASEASLLVHRLGQAVKHHSDIEVVLAPSHLTLQPLSLQIDRRKFRLAAQNAYFRDEGAYTGEVSFNMLRELVHYCLIGHSERRHIFHEDLPMVQAKMKSAIRNGITPILCVGETAQERADGETRQVLHDQLSTALANLTAKEVGEVIIAYEPVWAIGSGRLPVPADVKTVAGYTRSLVGDVFGEGTGHSLRILYGGSVTPEVITSFLDGGDVDGFLVGGASLNYQEFADIIDNAYTWQRSKGE